VVFECEDHALVGILHAPRAYAGKPGVLVVVGGPQYRVGSHRQFVLLARSLAAEGYPSFRFDYRGMGDSGGESRGFEKVDSDIRCALDAFQRAVPQLSGVVLWGLCDGASAILLSDVADARLRGLVLVNPWVRSAAGEARSTLRHYYRLRLLQPSFWKKLLSGSFDFRKSIGALGGAVARTRAAGPTGFVGEMLRGFAAAPVPSLVLTSDADLTAREFEDLCERDPAWRRAVARPTVTKIRLDGADHTFSERAILDGATDRCIAWLRRVAAEASADLRPQPARHSARQH
jgi:exosortase A-associated hydrolase 1